MFGFYKSLRQLIFVESRGLSRNWSGQSDRSRLSGILAYVKYRSLSVYWGWLLAALMITRGIFHEGGLIVESEWIFLCCGRSWDGLNGCIVLSCGRCSQLTWIND